jgi:ABC-2 type transport system permease protein
MNRALATPTMVRAKRRNLARIYLLEAKAEFLKLWRLPIYTVSTLVFPLMFYVIFGLTFGAQSQGPISVTQYMLATYGAFGVIGATLFGFGVGVATERGQGWLRLKRASPMPSMAYFAAKLVMALMFSALVVLGLFACGYLLGGVRMPAGTWLSLFGVLLLGVFPFSALGLAIGYITGPNSAPAVINLIYIPMVFASGLWIPIDILPKFVQSIAPFLPPYHYAQLALGTIGASQDSSIWLHTAVLMVFTAVFLVVAVWGYRRDEGTTYG